LLQAAESLLKRELNRSRYIGDDEEDTPAKFIYVGAFYVV
jgi:hypothetical protein